MTIVAGIPGKGTTDNKGASFPDRTYVVLGADSEQGEGVIKSSVQKIETIQKEGCTCLIGGAGDGDFIDAAIQEISETLSPPFSPGSVRHHIERIVTEYHTQRIDLYPNPEDYNFQLLCGIWVQGHPVQLVGVKRGVSVIQKRPTALGIGTYLARYLLDTYHYPNIPLYHSLRLAVYLLSQVKKHVPACGGTSQVKWLDDQGTCDELWPVTVTRHETAAAVVMEAGAMRLLHLVEPFGWSGDWTLLDQTIDDIGTQLKSQVRQLWARFMPPPIPADLAAKLGALVKDSPSPSLSTSDPSTPPPSTPS